MGGRGETESWGEPTAATLKPSIPERENDGIPLADELELEVFL